MNKIVNGEICSSQNIKLLKFINITSKSNLSYVGKSFIRKGYYWIQRGITQYHIFTPVIYIDMRHDVMRTKIMHRWTLSPKHLFDRRREFFMAMHNVLKTIKFI